MNEKKKEFREQPTLAAPKRISVKRRRASAPPSAKPRRGPISSFLRRKADPEKGAKLLFDAIERGNLVKFFSHLRHTPRVDMLDDLGETLLMKAVKRRDIRVVKAVMVAKADVNQNGFGDWTAFLMAAREGDVEIASFLLSKKADMEGKNAEGWNALMLAAQYGQDEMADFLISLGVRLDEKNIYGDTALMIAVRRNHTDILEALIAAGANVNKKNNVHESAFDIAISKGHVKAAQILAEHGGLSA